MNYSKSKARVDFIEVTAYLIDQSKFSTIKKNNINKEIQQTIFKSAIFQTSAALETYLETLLEDWIFLLGKNNKKISEVPEELILWICGKKQSHAFKDFLISGNESKLISQLKALKTIGQYYDPNSLVEGLLYKSDFVNDRKYPSPKNIKMLFARFGIENIFKDLARLGKKDFLKLLESFSDLRTEIAHQHPSKDITYLDLRQQITNIQTFVHYIDRLLHKRIQKISSLDCWNDA